MDIMSVIGPVLVLVIVGVVYWYFTNIESKEAEKVTDRHVKKTMADVEMEKLKTMQEELRLKKEYFEFEKERLRADVPRNIDAKRLGDATYTVKSKELEDKTKGTHKDN